MGRRRDQEASSSRALAPSGGARDLCTSSGAIPRTFAPQKPDLSNVSPSSLGTKKRSLFVKANFFAIENFNKDIAFHYDVTFNPDKPKKLLRLVWEEIKKIYFPDNIIAFDGVKNAYTMIPIAGGKNEIMEHKIKIPNKNKNRDFEFKVAIKLVARVDLALVDQRCIHILEVVLRSAAAVKYTPVGRSFFSLSKPSIPLMDGLVIRSGLHFSVRQGSDKLYVNFDSIHKAFLKAQPIVDTIREMFSSFSVPPPIERQIFQLRIILKGVKVAYSVPTDSKPRFCTIADVSKPPDQITCEFKGSIITVEEYFKNVKNYSLKYRNLPCLKVGSSAFVPAELCSIVEDQVVQTHLSDKQSGEMIKLAAIDPSERVKKIQAEKAYLDFENSPFAKGFGINMNSEFQEIRGHVLDPPKLAYNEGLVTPENGRWHSDSLFLQSAVLKKWTIFILDRCIEREDADKLASQLIKQGRDMGLTIDKPYPFRSLNTRSGGNIQFFEKELSMCSGFDLVIVVGNNKDNVYTNLKNAADRKLNICTQFIKSTTLRRYKDYSKIIHNIILKLNAKLGGVNHALNKSEVPAKFSNASVVYVGADVTHPSVGEIGSPSVAAVCASHDASGFRYNGQICIQPPKEEIIIDLERIMIHNLNVYEKNMGKKPEIILFFRDGVGEGQFDEVKSKEITAIQRACSKFGPDYNAKITFLVVQKCHHACFFPVEQTTGRNKNVPPGTVVDNTITNPKDREFYLVSHYSPRGCSRPCRYHCLWDDNELSENELQEIVYYQCYTYSRCEQSVSYPAPTYYAHHAAARGKLYLVGDNCRGRSKQFDKQPSCKDKLQELPGMYFI
ncbi:hypothetical protein R5R35_005074 [Gryllus longicercus]|uniref:Protein argonaute-2 n=1 Tax=Gryllus longicercus TaxID=2509291 RepID=A0AAN9Z209_9ORTH